MDTATLLASLSDAFGVSGFEDEVREIIRLHVSTEAPTCGPTPSATSSSAAVDEDPGPSCWTPTWMKSA